MEAELVATLIDIIKREETLLNDFLELLEEQKGLLVKNETETFEATVIKQEALIEQIRELEEQRIAKVRKIAENLEVKESELTITRLVELSLGTVSNELRQHKQSMNGLVGRIRRANQVNQYLIKRSLNLNHRTIDILIDENLRDVTYEKDGTTHGQDRRSLMINKTL
ncbi:flgN protein [bacterium BMS3Bbin04]|nr:flgN protein [bacterium BMS3Bbin04]